MRLHTNDKVEVLGGHYKGKTGRVVSTGEHVVGPIPGVTVQIDNDNVLLPTDIVRRI